MDCASAATVAADHLRPERQWSDSTPRVRLPCRSAHICSRSYGSPGHAITRLTVHSGATAAGACGVGSNSVLRFGLEVTVSTLRRAFHLLAEDSRIPGGFIEEATGACERAQEAAAIDSIFALRGSKAPEAFAQEDFGAGDEGKEIAAIDPTERLYCRETLRSLDVDDQFAGDRVRRDWRCGCRGADRGPPTNSVDRHCSRRRRA